MCTPHARTVFVLGRARGALSCCAGGPSFIFIVLGMALCERRKFATTRLYDQDGKAAWTHTSGTWLDLDSREASDTRPQFPNTRRERGGARGTEGMNGMDVISAWGRVRRGPRRVVTTRDVQIVSARFQLSCHTPNAPLLICSISA